MQKVKDMTTGHRKQSNKRKMFINGKVGKNGRGTNKEQKWVWDV